MDDELQTSGHHITQSVYWLLLRLTALIFLFETAYVLLLLGALDHYFATYHTAVILTLWTAQTIKFILEAIFVAMVVVPWATTHFYIRDDDLVTYSGLWRRQEKTYNLKDLKAINLHQSFIGRIFNYGDLDLTIAASGFRDDVRLHGIYYPKRYERILKTYLPGRSSNPVTG